MAIIDCVHSTGGSAKAAIKAFNHLGIEVSGVYVVVNKVDYNDQGFLNKMKDSFFAIFDVEIIDGRVKAGKSKYFY